MPRRPEPAWAALLRKVPLPLQRALEFVNDGRFVASDRVIEASASPMLGVLRKYVAAQLTAIAAANGGTVELDDVDCEEGAQLQDFALKRQWALAHNPQVAHQVTRPATSDEREEIDVTIVRTETALGLSAALKQSDRLRLRVCAFAPCSHWFVATDARQKHCTPACTKAVADAKRGGRDRRAEYAAYHLNTRKQKSSR